MKNYVLNRAFKPDFKKCKDCGAYGKPNRACKYWVYDSFTEWGCKHPKALKKEREQ